jgi:hypothetical protein
VHRILSDGVQARGTILAFLTAAAVLSVIETDRLFNLSHFVHGRQYSSARSVFAGFIVSATADFALVYHLVRKPLIKLPFCTMTISRKLRWCTSLPASVGLDTTHAPMPNILTQACKRLCSACGCEVRESGQYPSAGIVCKHGV